MKCFHHNDLDGFCSARIVSVYENNFSKYDFIEMDYKNPIPTKKVKKGEKVYIVDYSISENTYQSLIDLLDITEDVTWIDHHASSLEMLKNHHEIKSKVRNLVVDKSYSGAALTYMYLYNIEDFDEIPAYIRFVSDYDTWAYNYGKETEYFKCGIESYSFRPFDTIWDSLEKDAGKEDFLSELIESGRSVRKYLEENYRFKRSYLCYDRYIDGYKALVINLDGNSWVFGNEIDNPFTAYEVFILWSYDGEFYHYSLYSSSKRDNPVDVSKIAEKYGGGGHKHAAGFNIKTMFEDYRV